MLTSRLKEWGKPVLIGVLICLLSAVFGYFFAEGVRKSGGLSSITIRLDCDSGVGVIDRYRGQSL